MEHDKRLTLRTLIIRDYSVMRDDLLANNGELFEKFNILEREPNYYDFSEMSKLLNDLDDYLFERSATSKKVSILSYIDKL
ncbi:TPA: hypothetical protein U2B88_002169 [Streptococcus suis]|nr:hypothetical protein [Streptococcus suis]